MSLAIYSSRDQTLDRYYHAHTLPSSSPAADAGQKVIVDTVYSKKEHVPSGKKEKERERTGKLHQFLHKYHFEVRDGEMGQ